MAKARKLELTMDGISKCPTGIQGLDEVTFGGLPRGRPTLVCGGAGCGKTLLGMEFLVRGATQYNEPGVCLSFEETGQELAQNMQSLGFDVNALISQKKLDIDYVQIERNMVEETGEYDLEALFVRLGQAVDSIGAKRVVLDSIESLFSSLANEVILRSELRRLFRWLKDRKLTAVVTGERGEGRLTRHGLEEYISDCVILLDHRVTETVFTRRLRVVKYRTCTGWPRSAPTRLRNIMKRKSGKISDEVKKFEKALSLKTIAGRYVLSLFVTGSTPKSLRAIQNIRALCEEMLNGCYELKVIDIYQHPEKVESKQIVVTPTLIKKRPLPLRILIGDLSNKDRLLLALDIVPKNAAI